MCLSDELDDEEFCFWLQGYYELSERAMGLWDVKVRDHLALVFTKITPDRNDDMNFGFDEIKWDVYRNRDRNDRDTTNDTTIIC